MVVGLVFFGVAVHAVSFSNDISVVCGVFGGSVMLLIDDALVVVLVVEIMVVVLKSSWLLCIRPFVAGTKSAKSLLVLS